MQWIHVKACFKSESPELAEEIISDIFFSLGVNGVVCEVPLPEPEEGYASDAVPLPKDSSVAGYLPDTDLGRQTLERISQELTALNSTTLQVTVSTRRVDQEDWAESWKEFFFTFRVTDRIVIRPVWRDYDAAPGDIVIHMDPGMAFGTGTHPTTAMCLGMIEQYLIPGSTFLDVGTGSGILMIAASKLGAGSMAGLDTDEIAVRVAGENLVLNSISPDLFTLSHTTLESFLQHAEGGFDLIAANIIAEVIAVILPDIRQGLSPSGTAILSGIITDRLDMIRKAITRNNLRIRKTEIRGEWAALAVTAA